jgi:hypothetical protein
MSRPPLPWAPLGVVEKFVDNEIAEYPLMLLAELDELKKKGITEEEAKNLWLVECKSVRLTMSQIFMMV